MLLRNPGFVIIAAAVRSATVGAQAARHNGRPDHREIYYGLLNDLRRTGLIGRGELLAVVSSFVSVFNRESFKRRAILRSTRSGEMDAFANLLERLPSEVPAASILIGLASCLRRDAAADEVEPELVQAISA
jgi:hypothetical protein